jgi:hypothetical protein
MIFENRDRMEDEEYKFMFLAATRRAAKTTSEASMLSHAATIGAETLLCAGASTKDLEQLAKNFKIDNLNKNPAFRVYNITNDWSKKVELGIKTKSNKSLLLSTLHIINTDSGTNREIFAGFTPSKIVVMDEVMKSIFLEAIEGLIPALVGSDGGIRAHVVLSGTAGTEELSSDGVKALNDPETYGILPMQWDILERGIEPQYITWDEDRLRPFGTFIPGQCRVDMPKIESTLADYLGKPNSKELKKIKIKITDWKAAKEKIEKEREEASKDKVKLHKTIIYAPITTSEITMSGKRNRFPVLEAKNHKEYLLETGAWDRRKELIRDSLGRIKAIDSKKPLADFPHRGGIVDAPFLIFEDIPTEKPKYGTYCAGFDDYASDVWEKWLMLMEAYNLDQTAFGENFNYGIKDFLERRHLADKYLAPSLDFSQNFTIPNNGRRKTGWNPSTSKRFLFDLFVEYCNESYEFEQEDGTVKVLKGVQLIDDIGLLEEIIKYSDTLNVDRITSAMASYAYCFFLRSSHKFKVINYKKDAGEEKPKEKKERNISHFNNRNRGFYSNNRR